MFSVHAQGTITLRPGAIQHVLADASCSRTGSAAMNRISVEFYVRIGKQKKKNR